MEEDWLKMALEEYFQTKEIQYKIKDLTKGCDNYVFLVQRDNNSIVVRFPKKSKEERPPSHSPKHLHWVLNQCVKVNMKVPIPLYSNESVYIEEYSEGFDFKELAPTMTKKEIHSIFFDIGSELKKLHSIKTSKFSYMSEIPGIATKDNHFQQFEEEMIKNAISTHQNNNQVINEVQLNQIKEILKSFENYLKSFSDPRLIHGDISFNNIRVNRKQDNFELVSVIDFSDCSSGDPLYDFGEIFDEVNCDWEIISSMEKSYGSFKTVERDAIVFYALYYAIWLERKETIEFCIKFFNK
jgi:aminoglycoside phosphotransferase (APT) family kinase protein